MRSRWILAAVSTALFGVQIDYFAMNLGLPRMATVLPAASSPSDGGPLSNQIPEFLKSVERPAGVISPTWPR